MNYLVAVTSPNGDTYWFRFAGLNEALEAAWTHVLLSWHAHVGRAS